MDGDTYGGYAWIAQLLSALNAAASQNINLADLLGYYTEGAEPATPDPTENDALDAIWANRPDLKEFYDNAWGEGQYDPREAVRNWLAMTDEIQDPGPTPEGQLSGGPAVTTNPRDPLTYALEQGYVQPGSEGSEGERVPTLEREQWESEFLRQQGLDEEAIRQFNEQLQLQREQLAQQNEQWNAEHLRKLGLDEEAARQWQEEFERQKGLDAEETRRWNEEFLRQRGLDEEAIRQFDANLEWQRYQLGEDTRRWQAEYLRQQGLDAEAVRQWEAEHALRQQELELKGQLGHGELGLGYLNLLGSLRGPDNWMQYWNVQRNAQNTQLPAWASALLGNVQQTPAFQGAGTGVPEGMSGIQGAPDAMMQQGGGIQLQPTGDAAQQTFAAMSKPFVQGHQVTPAQWASLNPSEQAGLGSVIEYQGGYMPDWMQSMMKAAPKVGQGAGGSYFQGW